MYSQDFKTLLCLKLNCLEKLEMIPLVTLTGAFIIGGIGLGVPEMLKSRT